MDTKKIPFDLFLEGMQGAVLHALDEYMVDVSNSDNAKGWRDSDLPMLFKALEFHAERVAARFNDLDSNEVGSAYLSIVYPEKL